MRFLIPVANMCTCYCYRVVCGALVATGCRTPKV